MTALYAILVVPTFYNLVVNVLCCKKTVENEVNFKREFAYLEEQYPILQSIEGEHTIFINERSPDQVIQINSLLDQELNKNRGSTDATKKVDEEIAL